VKALVYEGPRVLNLREVDMPEIRDDEVLIRVEKVGICGSELSGYLGHNSLRKPPLIMGHEFAGTVAAVGARCTRLKPGDRVTANPLVSCGHCPDCQDGKANLCEHRYLIGAGRAGAFAEYAAVPEKNVYVLPEHMTFDDGAMVEPFACAVRICRLASLAPGDAVFIAGAGPIGLFALQAVKVYGIDYAVVLDINPQRLEIVEELEGTAVRSAEELRKVMPSRGFHAAIDAVGIDATRRQCMETVRPGGSVVFAGLHAAESPLPVNTAVRSEIRTFGSFGYNPVDFEKALTWIADGKADLTPWLAHAPLEDGQDCFEKLLSDPGKTAKIMLTVR
jgi:2-desacetyl-2-hydroxyethyl bacteriochlorophyllide A dehydrogenase